MISIIGIIKKIILQIPLLWRDAEGGVGEHNPPLNIKKILPILFFLVLGQSLYAQTGNDRPNNPNKENTEQRGNENRGENNNQNNNNNNQGNAANQADPFLEKDTLDIPVRYQKIKHTYNTDFPLFESLDTTLNNFQYYNPVEYPNTKSQDQSKSNPLEQYRWLGNIGQYHFPLTFQHKPNMDFNWGFNNLSQYDYTLDNLKYYDAKAPYTYLRYNWGLYSEQSFNAVHTQNIKKNLNITIDYRIIGSGELGDQSTAGLYANQKTKAQNLGINTWYISDNKRYQNWFSFAWNKYNLAQNGGVSNYLTVWRNFTIDGSTPKNPFVKDQPVVVNVNLRSARREDKKRTIAFKQSYSSGFQYEDVVIDTVQITIVDSTQIDSLELENLRIQADSIAKIQDPFNRGAKRDFDLPTRDTIRIDTNIQKSLIPVWAMTHQIAHRSNNNLYFDPTANIDFYPATFVDSTGTNDSLLRREWDNEFAFLLMGRNPFKKDTTDLGFRAKAAFNHQFINLNSQSYYNDTAFLNREENLQNAYLRFELFNQIKQTNQAEADSTTTVSQKVNKFGQFLYDTEAAIALWGYQAGSFLLRGKAGINTKYGLLSAEYQSSSTSPNWLYLSAFTNHHQWANENDTKNIKNNQLSLEYKHPKSWVELSFTQYLLTDYLLLNENQQPEQLDNIVSIQQFGISNKLNWKKWHLQSQAVAQISNQDKVPLPNFIYTGSLWYENNLFQNSLYLQAGIMLTYNSNYYAPAFAPSIAQFYYQNEVKQSFYPVVDFFINAKVRTARFFIRTQNLTQSFAYLSNTISNFDGYFSAQDHPMYDIGIKAGLSWQFYD